MSAETASCWDDDSETEVEVTKPECGRSGTPTATGPFETLDTLITWVMTVYSIAQTIGGFVGEVAAGEGFVGGSLSLLGIAAPVGVWLAAVAGAVLMVTVVAVFWRDRCGDKETDPACTAGVVQEITPSFNSASDHAFPFTAMHDRVDTVVRCRYWPVVSTGAPFVFCGNDPDTSPMMVGYYRSEEVCAAGAGATGGAVVGAVGGIIAGAAAGAAIGCATVILCAVAIVVAFLVAAVAALVGAIAGGQIGRAAADDSTPSTEGGVAISVGDFVTRKGGVLIHPQTNEAKVYWFVEDTHLHGESTESPPFSFRDLEEDFRTDAC